MNANELKAMRKRTEEKEINQRKEERREEEREYQINIVMMCMIGPFPLIQFAS